MRKSVMNWVRRSLRVVVLSAVTFCGLAGCVANQAPQLLTPKAADANFGYIEKTLSDTSYEIIYYGPEIYTELTVRSYLDTIEHTAQETSTNLALWRAAQLAAAKGYKGFKVTDAKGIVRHYIIGRDYENVPVSEFQNVTIRQLGYWSATYFRGEAALTVEFTNDTGGDVHDAAQTVAAMSDRYTKAVSEPIMADTQYYFGPSSWLYGYDENYKEAPVFESSKSSPRPPDRKPLGQPYYAP